MADERDPWLDRDAAERMLRGEPVEAGDEHVRARSEQLSQVLRDMRAVTYANETYANETCEEELPGEAAALAAFRKAVAESGGAREAVRGREAVGAGAGAGNLLGTVRIALAPGAVRAPRFARPMRRGLAAAVAGCALGGIVVAAGVGVLPPIFGDGHDPVPVNSVSTVTSPGPLVSGSPDGSRDPATPSGTPSGTVTERPSPPLSSPSRASGGGGALKGEHRGETDGDADGDGGENGTGTDPWPGRISDTASEEWSKKTVKVCRAYHDGVLDPQRKKALESAAKGPEGAARFCARLLDGDLRDHIKNGPDDKGGKGDKGGQIGNGGRGEDDGGDDGEGDSGKGGGGGFVGSPGVPTHQAPPPPPNWTPAPFEPPTQTPVPDPDPVPTPSVTPTPPTPTPSVTPPTPSGTQTPSVTQVPSGTPTPSVTSTSNGTPVP
ncbi:hypothetical protein [Streptomyces sp. NPDC056730]|uniref:hypothetical protein n=1 Tax=unclassified Streptomyces TaxID=2593676 RepID=UPI003678933B